MVRKYKTGRLGEEIRKIISNQILTELKDPAFSKAMVSVSAVEAKGDGSVATVFLTVMPMGEFDKEGNIESIENDVLIAMKKVKGHLRSEIGRGVKLRIVPDLIFRIDKSQDYGMKMDKILDQVKDTMSHDYEDAE